VGLTLASAERQEAQKAKDRDAFAGLGDGDDHVHGNLVFDFSAWRTCSLCHDGAGRQRFLEFPRLVFGFSDGTADAQDSRPRWEAAVTVLIGIARALGLAAAVLAGTAQAAQPDPQAAPNVANDVVGRELSAAPVSPDASMAAFKMLDGWVRALAVPENATAPQGLESITGCAISLRLDHHVIGRATRFGGPEEFVRAARTAIEQAVPRLPVGHDALAEEQLKDAAKRITISLELAGTLIPVKLATFDDADAELDPGLDGVAARIGEKLSGTFPAAMLIMNKTPGECLAAAISDASGDPTLAIPGSAKNEAGTIATEQKATYYRFRTVQLAQPDEGKAPRFMKRGGRVIEPFEIDTGAIRVFADQLATNIAGRASRQEGVSPGAYVPYQGRYEIATAPTLDALMSVTAIAQWSCFVPPCKMRDGALIDAYRQLSKTAEDARQDPIDAAAWMIAAAALDAAPKPPEKIEGASTDPNGDVHTGSIDAHVEIDAAARAKVGAVVASAFDAQTGWMPQVRAGGKSLITYALAIEAVEPGLKPDEAKVRRDRAQAAVASLYKDTQPKLLVSHTPWLQKAEILLAGDAKALPSAAGMRDLRDEIWKHQLTVDDAGPGGQDLDLVGGIVFTSARNPLPTWRSVQPIIFLAQAARDPRLTDDKEKLREISRLLSATRFLRQLMLDDSAAYAAEDPLAAIGGIRASLWDQRQPVEATAMTLMAACEMLKTLGVKPQP
jgi:hypothetical protein